MSYNFSRVRFSSSPHFGIGMTKPTTAPRRRFASDDDEQLRVAVAALAPATWEQIADAMGGRWTARQLRERYNAYLCPHLSHEWTSEDDRDLLMLHREYGNHWAKIAGRLRNRSNVSVRNRFRILEAQGLVHPPEPAPVDESENTDDVRDWEETTI
jgi:hypothetical protein